MERLGLRFLVNLKLKSPEKVIEICMDLGLIAREPVCPACKKKMSLKPVSDKVDMFEWICRTKSAPVHRVKRSVRSGSYFERSGISIADILLLTHMLIHRADQDFVSLEMSISSHKVCHWHSFIREVCFEECSRMNDRIGGRGAMVEVVESKLGKRKMKRVEGEWVFVGVQGGSNKCFFKVVEKNDKETLLNIMETCVLPGSTVYSDCWESYDCLEDEGFKRLTVDCSLRFENTVKYVRSKGFEGNWPTIKKALYNRTDGDDFDLHLADYIWRRVNSDSNDLTRAFLKAAARSYPPCSRDVGPEEEPLPPVDL